jgi:hypothetical protein
MNTKNQKAISQIAEASDYVDIADERYLVESLIGSPFIPDINPNTEKKI